MRVTDLSNNAMIAKSMMYDMEAKNSITRIRPDIFALRDSVFHRFDYVNGNRLHLPNTNMLREYIMDNVFDTITSRSFKRF